ncbi:hypothetical protein PCANC_02324 [Puccinia coronata f. sp. avenae]|uniref:Uncharacterized protein n=1 Tax=Puccinia coronata f. sp. avenae TaxID=200324 RepID=A0A2N5VZG7_9BASI|nr:hypothetical protein PCANC_25086 [Puccinia coronata f. sp. avenae]PLW55391.1 hypothetical protein PCANC_02324 [Puccinia coronata f. sp. avenae]
MFSRLTSPIRPCKSPQLVLGGSMALALLTGLQPANRPTSAFPGPNLPAPAHGSQTLLPSSRQPLSTSPRKSPHDHQHVQCHAPEVLHPTQHGFQMCAQQKSQQLFQLQQMQPKQQQLQENRKIQAQQHAASQRSQNGLGMISQRAPGLLPAASIVSAWPRTPPKLPRPAST